MSIRAFIANLLTKMLINKLASTMIFLSPLLTGAFLSAQTYLAQFLRDPTGQIAFRAIAITIAVVPLPFAAYFYFKPRLIFEENQGVFRDTKTGILYCPSCIVKNIQSPLSKNDGYWRCVLKDCRATFDDLNHIAPQVKTKNKITRGNYS